MIRDPPEWLIGAMLRSYGRIPLVAALYIMLLLQVLNAGNTLSEADQETLTNLIDLGYTTVGAYEVVAYLIFFWAFAPVIGGAYVNIAGPRIRRRLGVGADD